MIANFWITKTKNQLIGSELSSDKFYIANFAKVNIIFPKNLEASKIYELQTNLIERSGFNPMRSVTFFSLAIGQNCYTYMPTQKIYYKMSLSNFKAPVFTVRCVETGDYIDIQEIAVQLDIRETNGWF